jgi:pSer/pThr/pTyr-binding forkhead associated (FHA) protein
MTGDHRTKIVTRAGLRRGKPVSKDRTAQLSSTLEIPVEAVFGNVETESTAYIDITCPELQPQTIPLGRSEVIIGRESFCPICLPVQNVSRRHAKLRWNGDDCILEDMDSTNGTFVNNIKVSRCVLRNNDQIRIGQATIVFAQHKMAGPR